MNRCLLTGVLIISFSMLSCTSYHVTQKTDALVIPLNSATSAQEDSTILGLINPYKDAIDREMNEIIGYAERPLKKDNPEGLLNNLVSDIVLEETNLFATQNLKDVRAAFVVLNNGGLRASLPEGAITTRNIFELMPFDNEIVILHISGENAEKLFNYIARQQGVPVAGLKMGIKDDKAVNVLVKGKPFDASQGYYLATSDYLANGGDKMSFFSNPLDKISTGYLVRDALINYFKRMNKDNKVIDSQLDKRIYFEQ